PALFLLCSWSSQSPPTVWSSHMINGVTLKFKSLQITALSVLLAACGGSAVHGDSGAPRHVFEIVMENHSAAEALSAPFTASLAARYGVANNYRAVAHPSVPNYLALTSGSTWGITDDSYHVLPKHDLGSQLTAANVSWRAYMDGLGERGCLNSPIPYDPAHTPLPSYGGGCPPNVAPFTALAGDQ